VVDEVKGQKRIDETQTDNAHDGGKQFRAIEVEKDDLMVVLSAPDGFAPSAENQIPQSRDCPFAAVLAAALLAVHAGVFPRFP
jgi:hypothetical protein